MSIDQQQPLDVVTEAAINVMVFAMHISSDRSADRDIACAGGDGKKKASRHNFAQDLIEADAGSRCEDPPRPIQNDPIEGRKLNHSAVAELSGIAIGATQTSSDQGLGAGVADKLLHLLDRVGLNDLRGAWIGASPTGQKAGFGR